MVLQFRTRIATGQTALDTDLRDLQIVGGAQGGVLYAATGRNGGLSAWRLAADGTATLADTAYFTGAGFGMNTGPLSLATIGGGVRLMLAGAGAGALAGYAVQPDGGIGGIVLSDLPGAGGTSLSALAAAGLEGGLTAVYGVDAATGALGAYVASAQGTLQDAAPASGPAAVLAGRVTLAVAEAGGTGFLLAADAGMQGVTSYRIAPETGALTPAGSLGQADGLGMAAPAAMRVVTVQGNTWVIVAAAGSGSLGVLRLGADGRLTPADHLLDTRATRFAGVQALEVIEAAGRVFVIAGGADDGLSLFTLLPDGILVYLQSLPQAADLGLENVTAIAAMASGDAIAVFVAAAGAPGLTQFSLPLAGLGAVRRDTGAGDAELTGTMGDDLLQAGPGADRLIGRAGDDILVAGPEGGILTGGAGADLFVLRPGARVTDFEPGADRLDPSLLPMLRDPGQLDVQSTAAGARVAYRGAEITIDSRDGQPLTAADLWGAGFGTPDRVGLAAPPAGVVLYGTAAGDDLTGTAGDDRIVARSGNDRAAGAGGGDILRGGDGRDRLAGGAGDDRLAGGNGNDTLTGGRGGDVLRGGGGRDMLAGGGAGDRLFGGPAEDLLRGGMGRDMLAGGAGDDLLRGGTGRDRLRGDAGDDLLAGGAGADVFVFGTVSGADTITDFTPGADRIRLIAGPAAGFADLAIRGQGADVLIDTGAGTILLSGLSPADLTAEDFLFV